MSEIDPDRLLEYHISKIFYIRDTIPKVESYPVRGGWRYYIKLDDVDLRVNSWRTFRTQEDAMKAGARFVNVVMNDA